MIKLRTDHGFTLIELTIAVFITAWVMFTVSLSFQATLNAREEVHSLAESTEAGPRILTMIERDLLGLWHHDVKGNKVLIGRNFDISGSDSDRIDFLTTTDAVAPVLDTQNLPRRPSVCEVGYWLRENKDIPGLLQLWRREDPMIDDNLLAGGTFQLVHDRLKSFNITYYETLGHDAEPLTEWDSSKSDALPRRIKIEFTLERKLTSRNAISDAEIEDFEGTTKKYTREIVFDRRIPDILKPGIAMVPVFPPRPAEQGGGGPAGPGSGPGNSTTNAKQNPNNRRGMPGNMDQRNGRGPGGQQQERQNRRGGTNTTTGEGGPPRGFPQGNNGQGINIQDLLRGAGGRGGGNPFGGGR